jgi:hypothetical protein
MLNQRFLMARISIKDLPQSDDLDREAMRLVLGGGLSGPRPSRESQGAGQKRPIVDYPPGFGGLGARNPKD